MDGNALVSQEETEIRFPLDIELMNFTRLRNRDGKNVLWAIGSSSLLHADDVVIDAITVLKRHDEQEAIRILVGWGYSENKAVEALCTIKQLIRHRILVPRNIMETSMPQNVNLNYLVLHLAHVCDLSCRYCFSGDGSYGQKGLMSEDIAKAAIALLPEDQKVTIGLFGGEPLLNKDVLRVACDYSRQKFRDCLLMISTNALNLDSDTIDFLVEKEVEIQLSCDGGKTLHDSLRPKKDGGGSFEKIVSALRELRRRGYQPKCRATATSLDPDPVSIASQLFSMGFHSVNIQPIHCDKTSELYMSDDDLEVYIQGHIKLIGMGLEQQIDFLRMILSRICLRYYAGQFCGFGYRGVSVTPKGDLNLCQRLVGMETYNVGNVWDGIDEEKVFEVLSFYHVDYSSTCSDCWVRYICGGGCPAINKIDNESFTRAQNAMCRLIKESAQALILKCANNWRELRQQQASL